MSKKKFAVISISVILCICLSSCRSADQNRRLSILEDDFSYVIIIDHNTGVEYLHTSNGGVTVMYNADGSILTEADK